jgi:hypothetical protein
MRPEAEPLVVTVEKLRSATTKILDAVEATIGPAIELAADDYWLLESHDAFDLSEEPRINAGRLSHDLASVRELNGRDDIYVWHDLDHLLGLLTGVSAVARP